MDSVPVDSRHVQPEVITAADVVSRLEDLVEPKLKWSVLALNLVKSVVVGPATIDVHINLVTQNMDEILAFRHEVHERLKRFVRHESRVHLDHIAITEEGISGVSNIVMVGSGKGGVGKSTVATNLAVSMAKSGLRIGLMDADIHGPSLPTLLGIDTRPEVLAEEYLLPVIAHGLKVMSVGCLVDRHKALDWRGSLASGTLLQFIFSTFWGDLDCLVIDLPPGTSDIQLTLAQKLPGARLLLVTTPQEVVLGDVRRTMDMFAERGTQIIGAVENFAYHCCEHCGRDSAPFGSAPQPKAEQEIYEPLSSIETLARLPISRALTEASDAGMPIATSGTDDALAELFTQISIAVIAGLQNEQRDVYPHAISPPIS